MTIADKTTALMASMVMSLLTLGMVLAPVIN